MIMIIRIMNDSNDSNNSPKYLLKFSMWPKLFRFMTMQEAECAYAPLLTARKETCTGEQ